MLIISILQWCLLVRVLEREEEEETAALNDTVEQWKSQGVGLPKVDVYHTDQKVASMEAGGGVALLFQPCRAFADTGLKGKVQLACLSEKLSYSIKQEHL